MYCAVYSKKYSLFTIWVILEKKKKKKKLQYRTLFAISIVLTFLPLIIIRFCSCWNGRTTDMDCNKYLFWNKKTTLPTKLYFTHSIKIINNMCCYNCFFGIDVFKTHSLCDRKRDKQKQFNNHKHKRRIVLYVFRKIHQQVSRLPFAHFFLPIFTQRNSLIVILALVWTGECP